MVVTVTFTIILVAILLAAILVVRSNAKLRKTINPEKKIDLHVGKDAKVRFSQTEEGNIRIDIEQFGEAGIPVSETIEPQKKQDIVSEEVEDGLGVCDSGSTKDHASKLLMMELYSVTERKEILRECLESGEIDDSTYNRLYKKYVEGQTQPATSTPETQAPNSPSATAVTEQPKPEKSEDKKPAAPEQQKQPQEQPKPEAPQPEPQPKPVESSPQNDIDDDDDQSQPELIDINDKASLSRGLDGGTKEVNEMYNRLFGMDD